MSSIIPNETRQYFAGMYLLEYMAHRPTQFKVFLESENEDLEPILEWLASQGYIEIVEEAIPQEVPQGFFKKMLHKPGPQEFEQYYRLNAEGQSHLDQFLLSYSEYLYFFDIFSAVDLESGEFAFAFIEEHHEAKESFPSQSWKNFIQEERFDDLRVAVAQYFNKDPIEIVFAHFLSEGRFGKTAFGWQFDLLLGSVWDEISEIVSSAIQLSELSYQDEAGQRVEAQDVMEDMISQAAEVLEPLLDSSGVIEIQVPTEDPEGQRKTLQKPIKSVRQVFGI